MSSIFVKIHPKIFFWGGPFFLEHPVYEQIKDDLNSAFSYTQKNIFFDAVFKTEFIEVLKSYNQDHFWLMVTSYLENLSQDIYFKTEDGINLINFLKYFKKSYSLVGNPAIKKICFDYLIQIKELSDDDNEMDPLQKKNLQKLLSSMLKIFSPSFTDQY